MALKGMEQARSYGKTVRIFLPDGLSTGLRWVEITNWSGVAYSCPRNKIIQLKDRSELDSPGVYLLVGPQYWEY